MHPGMSCRIWSRGESRCSEADYFLLLSHERLHWLTNRHIRHGNEAISAVRSPPFFADLVEVVSFEDKADMLHCYRWGVTAKMAHYIGGL